MSLRMEEIPQQQYWNPSPPTPENDSLYVSNTMPAASVLLGGHLLYL